MNDSATINNDGREILKAVQQVRNLFVEVSDLLTTADSMMKELGWESRAGNYAIAGASASLTSPRSWMPHFVWRFYKENSLPHKLPAISVVFDDDNGNSSITEPLITAVVLDYGAGEDVGDDYEYRCSTLHWRNPNREDDGLPISMDTVDEWNWRNKRPKNITSFGVPLVSIQDSPTLMHRVIRPLNDLARSAKVVSSEIGSV